MRKRGWGRRSAPRLLDRLRDAKQLGLRDVTGIERVDGSPDGLELGVCQYDSQRSAALVVSRRDGLDLIGWAWVAAHRAGEGSPLREALVAAPVLGAATHAAARVAAQRGLSLRLLALPALAEASDGTFDLETYPPGRVTAPLSGSSTVLDRLVRVMEGAAAVTSSGGVRSLGNAYVLYIHGERVALVRSEGDGVAVEMLLPESRQIHVGEANFARWGAELHEAIVALAQNPRVVDGDVARRDRAADERAAHAGARILSRWMPWNATGEEPIDWVGVDAAGRPVLGLSAERFELRDVPRAVAGFLRLAAETQLWAPGATGAPRLALACESTAPEAQAILDTLSDEVEAVRATPPAAFAPPLVRADERAYARAEERSEERSEERPEERPEERTEERPEERTEARAEERSDEPGERRPRRRSRRRRRPRGDEGDVERSEAPEDREPREAREPREPRDGRDAHDDGREGNGAEEPIAALAATEEGAEDSSGAREPRRGRGGRGRRGRGRRDSRDEEPREVVDAAADGAEASDRSAGDAEPEEVSDPGERELEETLAEEQEPEAVPEIEVPAPRARRSRAAVVVRDDPDAILAALILARDRRNLESFRVVEQSGLMDYFKGPATDVQENVDLLLVGFTAQPQPRDMLDTAELYRDRLWWLDNHEWPIEDLERLRNTIGSESIVIVENSESPLAAVQTICERRSRFTDKLVDLCARRLSESDMDKWGYRLVGLIDRMAANPGEHRSEIAAVLSGKPAELAETTDVYVAESAWVEQNDPRIVHFGEYELAVCHLPGGLDAGEVGRRVRNMTGARLSLSTRADDDLVLLGCNDEKRPMNVVGLVEAIGSELSWAAPRTSGDRVGRLRIHELPTHPERIETVIGEIVRNRSMLYG